MNTYTLEAVLNDGTIINLNFLISNSPDLLDIDKFTNQCGKWDFIHGLREYLDSKDVDIISSFQISVKGKDYHYSVIFQNPFLASVINQVIDQKKSLKCVVPSSTSGFYDMKKFLFEDLNQGGKKFLRYYQYQNRLSRLVNRYLCSLSHTEEDVYQKKLLEESILKELTNYKTYRSLCVYRNGLDRKINAVYRGPRPVINVKPQTRNFLSNSFQLDKDISSVYSRYQQIYVDDFDNEKEEFLDSSEIEEMGNYYGK